MQRTVIATVAAAAVFALVQVSAEAQTFVKPPPRLTPNVSEQSKIPAGIDSATSATSDTLPLGTPVPPVGAVDRTDQRTRSAAARAAARPPTVRNMADTPAASTTSASAECPAGSDAAFRRAMSACSAIANRADRAQCAATASQDRRDSAPVAAAPVALPGSGFVGSSAGPSTAAAATGNGLPSRGPARLGCV